MKMMLLAIVCALVQPVLAGDGTRGLVAAYGRHVFPKAAITVFPSIAEADAISFSVSFTTRVRNAFGPGFGLGKLDMTSTSSWSDFAVKSGAWAFYLAGDTEIWFYDGLGGFSRFHIANGAMRLSATCSDPTLGHRVPRALKQFARRASVP